MLKKKKPKKDHENWDSTSKWLFIFYFLLLFLFPSGFVLGDLMEFLGLESDSAIIIFSLVFYNYAFMYEFRLFPREKSRSIPLALFWTVSFAVTMLLFGRQSFYDALTIHGLIVVVGLFVSLLIAHVIYCASQIKSSMAKKREALGGYHRQAPIRWFQTATPGVAVYFLVMCLILPVAVQSTYFFYDAITSSQQRLGYSYLAAYGIFSLAALIISQVKYINAYGGGQYVRLFDASKRE
jgi:hypothetical protein